MRFETSKKTTWHMFNQNNQIINSSENIVSDLLI